MAAKLGRIQAVRGTEDYFPAACTRLRWIEKTAASVAHRFGFGEIRTPIFEHSEVFEKPLGTDSDVVNKEMYTFETRGNDRITLRPEGTTGVVRALLTNSFQPPVAVHKYYYHGPMFRYERPQKGRLRQFDQFGVELVGSSEWSSDIEVVGMAALFLSELGLLPHTKLHLNCIGDSNSREEYRKVLMSFLLEHKDKLSEDSVQRLQRGSPLRVLDSKHPSDQAVCASAPHMQLYLSEQSSQRFKQVQVGLEHLKVPFVLDSTLVRGLDYYTDTVFEFVTDHLGAKATVLAGGRYDGLVEQMGGKAVPGIGWAAGLERLALLCDAVGISMPQDSQRPVMLVIIPEPFHQNQNNILLHKAQQLAHSLRRQGLIALFPFETTADGQLPSAKKQLSRAAQLSASHAFVMGLRELDQQVCSVKNLDTGLSTNYPLEQLLQDVSHLFTTTPIQ